MKRALNPLNLLWVIVALLLGCMGTALPSDPPCCTVVKADGRQVVIRDNGSGATYRASASTARARIAKVGETADADRVFGRLTRIGSKKLDQALVLQPTRPRQESVAVEAPPAGRAWNFRSPDLLRSHWQKHGREFGPNVSEANYLSLARAFFNGDRKLMLFKHDGDGDTLQYRVETNEFGVLSGDGFIRTYFRPNDGIRYWNRQ